MAQAASNPKIEELRFRLKTDPKSRLFFPLAEELRKIDQFAEAEQVLRGGLAQHPTYLSAWVCLGRVLHESQKDRDAVDALAKALQLDPGNVVAARLLADSYLDLGDKLEAIKKYKLVRALMPAGEEELEAVIDRLDHELNAAPAKPPFMDIADQTHPPAPAPVDEAPFATHDSAAFADAEASLVEEQDVGVSTAEIQPNKEHSESPFEEPAASYKSATVDVPITEEEPAGDMFAPAEAPAPPAAVDDAANTITMADLYVQQGFADKARDIYQSILQRDPGNADVRKKLDALQGPAPRNPKAAKLEKWLAKVKKREEGSVV